MMKKWYFIIIILIVFIIYIIYNYFLFDSNKIRNDEINIQINNIKIEKCDSSYLDKMNGLFNITLSNSDREKFISNIEQYRSVCIQYSFYNYSKNFDMKDVRIEPVLTSELKNMVLMYNTGNGTYYINVLPNNLGGFNQYITINIKEYSDEELYQIIRNINSKLTYYSGKFGHSNGHALVGFGKHEVIFKLSNGEIITSK